jgi:serine/threonine protein kinase
LAFEEIYSFFKDITSGLAHLHASNYIHRDLKPSNCLLHKSGNDFRCLISDFGEVQAENVARKSTGATGTISYCAPEVLKKDATGTYANFTTKSDIFSLGMILYFMCFGRLPYSSADSIQEEFEDLDMLRAEISTWSGFKDERQERPDLPDQLYEFLKRLLAINPLERPSAEEILHAIRTESGLDSPPRVGRNNPANGNLRLDLGIGKRIQPLDTPASGTPEPRSNSRPPFATPEDADHERREATTISPPNESTSIGLPPKDSSKEFLARRDRSQTPPTPLLMAPPSTPLSTFQNQIAVYRHHTFTWAVHNHQPLTHGARLVIFVIKMYALTKPCLPLATDPFIAYPLLLLAALELAFGGAIEWRLSGVSLAVHFMVLALMARMNRLCAGGRAEWDWEAE